MEEGGREIRCRRLILSSLLAIGLFAAIPALIAYNKLQGEVAKNQARMESFADEFSAILSRQIDQHAGAERDRMAA